MNMSNATLAWEALSKLDFWVDINMFHHPGTEMADIILPCQHWTEINNIRVSQGASGGIGLTQRCIEPPADTKFDYDINRLIFEAIEKQGNPNGTWTNIAGDAPGAYHHDDRLEDWFQAHNEVSGFGDRYPGCKWEHWEDFREDFQENGWINAKVIEPDALGHLPPLRDWLDAHGQGRLHGRSLVDRSGNGPAGEQLRLPHADGLVQLLVRWSSRRSASIWPTSSSRASST